MTEEPQEGKSQGQASQATPGKPLPGGDKHRPLSQAPVSEVISRGHSGSPVKLRIDTQGRILCRAKRRDGELCKSPVVQGLRVCRMHGGSTPQARQAVKLRLADLASPAVAQVAKLMTTAENEAVRLKAAENILDRSGFGRQSQIDVGDAKAVLYERLLRMNEEQAEEGDGFIDDGEPDEDGTV